MKKTQPRTTAKERINEASKAPGHSLSASAQGRTLGRSRADNAELQRSANAQLRLLKNLADCVLEILHGGDSQS